jgi:hypothetical protein
MNRPTDGELEKTYAAERKELRIPTPRVVSTDLKVTPSMANEANDKGYLILSTENVEPRALAPPRRTIVCMSTVTVRRIYSRVLPNNISQKPDMVLSEWI